MNPAWNDRSVEDHTLFNSVFCALLLRAASRGYQEGDKSGAVPLAHALLVLPSS